METVEEELYLSNGTDLAIPARVGTAASENLHFLSSANTYTQIGRAIAISSNLRGHPRLIGHSQIANGNMKFDYLATCNVNVKGVNFPLVVKVGATDQPVLIGLDLVVAASMNIDIGTRTIRINTVPNFDATTTGFKFIDFQELMRARGLTDADLVPFTELVNAELDFFANAGTAHKCIDLGFSTSAGGTVCVDCGTSY